MTRAEKRALKNQTRNAIKEFLKIQAHYFPDLIDDIKSVMDNRNQSYITYEIEVIIFVMILKNIFCVPGSEKKTSPYDGPENHQVVELSLICGL